MQYSDHLDQRLKQHRNARLLGVPVTRNGAVTLANLSPLDWQAGNHQHSIHYDALTKASRQAGMNTDAEYATWHIRDYLVG